MQIAKSGWLLFAFISLLLIGSFPSITVEAAQVQSAETSGSIGFYGKYVSDSDPKPVPPTGPQEESSLDDPTTETLPYLGYNRWPWFWLGFILISLAFIMKRRHNLYHMA